MFPTWFKVLMLFILVPALYLYMAFGLYGIPELGHTWLASLVVGCLSPIGGWFVFHPKQVPMT